MSHRNTGKPRVGPGAWCNLVVTANRQHRSFRPGLAVTYDYARRVHVDDVEVLSNPAIGKPLDNIAHRTIDGKVLTAKRAMMVAAHIRGLIRFEAPGTYMFRIESNDGVKVRIGGQQIWVDPEIHPNRWSPPIRW